MLFLCINLQIIDTARGNFCTGQFICVDIDSGRLIICCLIKYKDYKWEPLTNGMITIIAFGYELNGKREVLF